MIAADTSSLINFLQGARTPDGPLIREALRANTLWLPPPVKTELMSGHLRVATFTDLMLGARLLPIAPGFWERAGDNRRLVIEKGLKAKLADTLIAQCCIDADVALIASDGDYRHFQRWCGLKLAT
ncbi:MAG: PIN domain-containing protein [Caulobacteraceae bacterium]